MNRDIPINEIGWLCTHNAFNSNAEIGATAESTGGTNQNHSIDDQLTDGVRAFMIDVHNFHTAPRVCHAVANPYEDLCDLLIKFKSWLTDEKNKKEIIILMMEVAKDVPAEWIKDTFEGQGPITRSADYNLKDLLYTHPSASHPWPTINTLVKDGKRVIVFRQTDEGQGQIADGMNWYHDMWTYWIENPYGNSNWDDIQTHTYQLLRGSRNTAAFFNLNHFVNTGHTGSGSAGFAQGMNMNDYLRTRALIAWRMQARRPTLSVDFFRSLQGEATENTYNTVDTAEELNDVPCIRGTITFDDGGPFELDVTWSGIKNLDFLSNGLSSNDYRIQSGSDGQGTALPTSHGGYFCFPPNNVKNGNTYTEMTIKPSCEGYTITPSNSGWDGVWDGKTSMTQNFTVKKNA